MTEIERKALALLNDVFHERGQGKWVGCSRKGESLIEALCRAIEQHEAFKREVSDAVEAYMVDPQSVTGPATMRHIYRFILPKPDPLVEALDEAWDAVGRPAQADRLRAALAKHGLRLERIEHE